MNSLFHLSFFDKENISRLDIRETIPIYQRLIAESMRSS